MILIHYFYYANEFNTLGIISSPPDGNGNADLTGDGKGRADDIVKMIDIYARDYPELKEQRSDYPSPQYLKSITVQGETNERHHIDILNNIQGAELIIRQAKADSSQPLWVLVWGALVMLPKR